MEPILHIVEVPIKELQAASYNPRKHSKEQADQLKESIQRFGLVDPVICNGVPERKNVIIGGHFRAELEELCVDIIGPVSSLCEECSYVKFD